MFVVLPRCFVFCARYLFVTGVDMMDSGHFLVLFLHIIRDLSGHTMVTDHFLALVLHIIRDMSRRNGSWPFPRFVFAQYS